MSTRIKRELPFDEYQAAVGANNPSAANVFATIADLTSGTVSADRLEHDVKYDEAGGILKGQAVYVSGASGTNILVKKADYSTEATSSKTLGLVTKDGPLNFQGTVITEGLLKGTGTDPLDTSMATIGDPIWLGDDGNLIYGLINKPYAPNHLVFIGIVTEVSATVGEIFVKVQNGFELDEIHDIDLKSNPPLDGEVLTYNALTDLWEAKPIPGVSTGGTQLLSGGASWSGTGMTFNVSTLTYTIDGDYYTSAPQNVTLAVGDPSNPRFDAIVVDAAGVVSVITGTPAANPLVPSVPGTQVLVQYVLVAANATTPSITNEFVYREGSSPDWTAAVINSNPLPPLGPPLISAIYNSTTPTPIQGTECTLVNAPSYTTARILQWTKPSGNISRAAFPFLSFRVQLLAGSANRNILVRLYNGTFLIGSLWAANYGLSVTTIGSWQLVNIPLSAFGNPTITTATRIQFLFNGSVVGTTQFAFDDIKFQSGYGPQANIATIDILDSGTVVGSTAKLNFIDGTNTTAVVTQDIPNNKIDVKIDAATTTLSSAGGTSLVNDGTGPVLAIKGLTAGSNINIVPNISGNDVAISAVIPSSYRFVADEGNPLTQRTTINFVGAGVTASDVGSETVVTINGGGAGGTIRTAQIGITDVSGPGGIFILGQALIYAVQPSGGAALYNSRWQLTIPADYTGGGVVTLRVYRPGTAPTTSLTVYINSIASNIAGATFVPPTSANWAVFTFNLTTAAVAGDTLTILAALTAASGQDFYFRDVYFNYQS